MAVKVKKSPRATHEEITWPYGRKNYLFFALALVVITVGYIFLAEGSMTLAPILLVVGYCVLIPVALLIKDRPANQHTDSPERSAQ